MGNLLYPVALIGAFTAAAMLAYGVLSGRSRAVKGFQVQRGDASKVASLWFRWFFPLLDVLAPACRALPMTRYRMKAATQLRRAALGDAVTVDHLLAMKVIMAILTPAVLALLMDFFRNYGIAALTGVGGFFVPDRLVSDLRRARGKQIVRNLPGAVDILSLSVEAGLEFLIAVQRLVERGAMGPLRDELATLLNEIRLGTSRSEALKTMGARLEIPEVTSFVSVLVQADMLGASIGPVLKSQAERMRVERFQRAEKAGGQATQKILFPLVLFIFPAVLVVIIGPVVLQFVYGQ